MQSHLNQEEWGREGASGSDVSLELLAVIKALHTVQGLSVVQIVPPIRKKAGDTAVAFLTWAAQVRGRFLQAHQGPISAWPRHRTGFGMHRKLVKDARKTALESECLNFFKA